MTQYLNPSIVPFVSGQFPPKYPEKFPLYVAFLRAYYEWLESETGVSPTTLYTRGFLDYRDVDRTTDQFFVHLKTKYLDGIRLETESDSRLLLKNAKDLYRAKGTPRGLQLFFRLLYDEAISIYYPKDDIMRMSSGVWTKPFYLELSIVTQDWKLASKPIVGLTSGAQGFVDSLSRRLVGGRVSSVAYLSAVTGNFQTGEIVTPIDGSLPVTSSPTIVGSMNKLIFSTSGSGAGYSVGDVVPVNSPHGLLGEARVTETVIQTGLIELELENGGYGYTSNAQAIVSDTVMAFSNVVVTNAYTRKYAGFGETVTQPLGLYNFVSANGTISNGSIVQAWSANVVVANATVLQATYVNTTAGYLYLSPISGNLNQTALYTEGNAISVSIGANGYVDKTATGSVVGTANLVLSFASSNGSFLPGEQVIQSNPLFPTDGSIQASGQVSVTSNGYINVVEKKGIFVPGQIVGQTSGASANISTIGVTVGVVTTNGSWSQLPGNRVYTDSIEANVSFVSSAITSTFGISSNLVATETYSINTDTLASIINAPLAGPYGLAANASANSSTNFSDMLTFANVTVGSIQNVYTLTPGQQVDAQPIVVLVDNRVDGMNDYDLTIYYANASTAFVQGEQVTQQSTTARGTITSVNSTSLTVTNQRMSLTQQFIPTVNSTTSIVGSQSGAVANITSVWADHDSTTGRDSNSVTQTITSVGAVTNAVIVDSGFCYVQGEQVWLGEGSTPGSNAAYGIVELDTAGTGRGYYSQTGGFMSSNKKFFDGDYYQEFSYEISSSHQLSDYVDSLKKIMHVAGMKVFGRYVHSRDLGTGVSSPGGALQGR